MTENAATTSMQLSVVAKSVTVDHKNNHGIDSKTLKLVIFRCKSQFSPSKMTVKCINSNDNA